jgi:glycosyltransferase involved in cell wall biosynthesis
MIKNKYKKKESIVLIIDGFKQGGTQQVYIMLLKEYTSMFKSVTLIILESTEFDLNIPKFINLNVIYLNSNKLLDLKAVITLGKILMDLKPNFIIASIYRSQIFSAFVKPKESKLIWVEQNTYHNRPKIQWLIMKSLSFRIFRIICTSNEILTITKQRISRRRSLLFPNPINLFESHGVHTPRNNDFVFIGRMVDQKNPFLAIQSFENFLSTYSEFRSSSRMHIIGEGYLLMEAKSLSIKLDIADKCIFHGDISIDKMMTILRNSKTLISTSFIEGFGLARLEALGAGCCVVSTNTGGTKDYLSGLENIGIFITTGSAENISEFMYETLRKDFWTKEVINRRINNVQDFSPSIISKKWLSV